MKELTEEQIELLFEAWDYCDQEDKSTGFMFSYMSSIAGIGEDVVADFVTKNGNKRLEWYKNKQNIKK